MELILLVICVGLTYLIYEQHKLKVLLTSKETSYLDGDDELYEKAKEVVIKVGKASTSLLQRELSIGYARAARLIDVLEEKGVIGSGKGSKPREILKSNIAGNKILLVDDDKFLLNMYSVKFVGAGFEVKTLLGAEDNFIGKVVEFAPNLISLDIIMPRIDGFDAISLLKKDERTKNIPVIFLSNQSEKIDVDTGIKLGAVDYIICSKTIPSEIVTIYSSFLNDPKNYKPWYLKNKFD